MSQEREEKFINVLMDKSNVKMPFDDFEERLMVEIHKEVKSARSIWKDVRLSWFFFIVGAIFGILLSTFSGELSKTIFGFPTQRVILVFQSLFVILLLLQFDKLIGLARGVSRQLNNE